MTTSTHSHKAWTDKRGHVNHADLHVGVDGADRHGAGEERWQKQRTLRKGRGAGLSGGGKSVVALDEPVELRSCFLSDHQAFNHASFNLGIAKLHHLTTREVSTALHAPLQQVRSGQQHPQPSDRSRGSAPERLQWKDL